MTSATNFRGDVAWGLTKLATGKLVVVGGQVGPGENRTDLDFAVIRLNADGSRDTAFGTDGVASVTAGPNVVESPETALELDDGRLVVTGYANIDGIVKVVLFRLTKQGTLDPTFGDGGVSVTQLGHVAESYAVAAVGDRLVTTGYGRDVADVGENGRRLFDVGGPNDAFFGVAVSPDESRVAVVGYLGRAADGADKDDSAVLWLKL